MKYEFLNGMANINDFDLGIVHMTKREKEMMDVEYMGIWVEDEKTKERVGYVTGRVLVDFVYVDSVEIMDVKVSGETEEEKKKLRLQILHDLMRSSIVTRFSSQLGKAVLEEAKEMGAKETNGHVEINRAPL